MRDLSFFGLRTHLENTILLDGDKKTLCSRAVAGSKEPGESGSAMFRH